MATKKAKTSSLNQKAMFLTVSDICLMLSMKESTARDWLSRQEAENGLDIRRFGRNVRVSATDLNRVIELHKTPTAITASGRKQTA